MAQVKLTIKAREDLKEIGRYTGQTWGRAKRIEYLRQLRVRMRDISAGLMFLLLLWQAVVLDTP